MIAKVSEQGMLIPKQLLGTASKLELREVSGRIVVVLDPVTDPYGGWAKIQSSRQRPRRR
jgi:hypothetical protein